MRNSLWLAVIGLSSLVGPVVAQTTGTPSFNAPYRAFSKSEFGATLSFPKDANFGIEGQYRFGYERFDLGFRGGLIDLGSGAPSDFVLGAEGRTRVIQHTESFPLDGAVVVGLGGNFIGSQNGVGGASQAIISGGLSLGRRVDPKDTQVSIVPYVEPTFYITSGGGSTGGHFAFGLGADFRLSKLFDARVSAGLGDVQGIAFSAVWVH